MPSEDFKQIQPHLVKLCDKVDPVELMKYIIRDRNIFGNCSSSQENVAARLKQEGRVSAANLLFMEILVKKSGWKVSLLDYLYETGENALINSIDSRYIILKEATQNDTVDREHRGQLVTGSALNNPSDQLTSTRPGNIHIQYCENVQIGENPKAYLQQNDSPGVVEDVTQYSIIEADIRNESETTCDEHAAGTSHEQQELPDIRYPVQESENVHVDQVVSPVTTSPVEEQMLPQRGDLEVHAASDVVPLLSRDEGLRTDRKVTQPEENPSVEDNVSNNRSYPSLDLTENDNISEVDLGPAQPRRAIIGRRSGSGIDRVLMPETAQDSEGDTELKARISSPDTLSESEYPTAIRDRIRRNTSPTHNTGHSSVECSTVSAADNVYFVPQICSSGGNSGHGSSSEIANGIPNALSALSSDNSQVNSDQESHDELPRFSELLHSNDSGILQNVDALPPCPPSDSQSGNTQLLNNDSTELAEQAPLSQGKGLHCDGPSFEGSSRSSAEVHPGVIEADTATVGQTSGGESTPENATAGVNTPTWTGFIWYRVMENISALFPDG